jgi:hypothetical protein
MFSSAGTNAYQRVARRQVFNNLRQGNIRQEQACIFPRHDVFLIG